jgi:mono/diheme cytochrome c family protein/plastocyanin
MVARRITGEYAARLIVIGILIGLPLAALVARWLKPATEIRARAAEAGGWTPADLIIPAGQPLHLRLTSDDVVHGFAVGQSDTPALEVLPGKVIETTLVFDEPGKYVYYCTRWCGLGHWRMRGTIEVTGLEADSEAAPQPLYAQLGLKIDEPHAAEIVPGARPSASRGAKFGGSIPAAFLNLDYYRAHAPVEAWRDLRAESNTTGLNDDEVWDLVAFVWQSGTSEVDLAEGQGLYAANCTACHGEGGAGDGIAAQALAKDEHAAQTEFGGHTVAPANFTDASNMLGASPALLQGKIVRGGMGTGMPYWGPIFTEAQTWALVDYLWTFVFDYQEAR